MQASSAGKRRDRRPSLPPHSRTHLPLNGKQWPLRGPFDSKQSDGPGQPTS
ncbi:hypothetical protein ACFPRL_32325 [Pseudoclavibacter helvolus]